MSDRHPAIVLIVEKPLYASLIAPLVADRWPSHRVFAICTNYLGLYEFSYPRNLSFAALPYIGEPTWHPRKFEGVRLDRVVELVNGDVLKTDLVPGQLLPMAASIWFACDPDSSGANAYQVLLTQCLGACSAELERPALFLSGLTALSIQRALDDPTTTHDPKFQALLNAGQAKRFFDYNYNVNSLALFGRALRKVGIATENYGLSKYGLQVLYALRNAGPVELFRMVNLMSQWPGTGRYEPTSLGSPASQAPILINLLGAGLTTETGAKIELSGRGRELLDVLHPDCEDRDLPARLKLWGRDWPVSRPAIERYLRTFFGKQLRFRGRNGYGVDR